MATGKFVVDLSADYRLKDPAAYERWYQTAHTHTDLLKQAKARGHRTVDGLSMLLYQAVPGFTHWFGVKPTVADEQRKMIEADILGKT